MDIYYSCRVDDLNAYCVSVAPKGRNFDFVYLKKMFDRLPKCVDNFERMNFQ